MYCLYGLSRSGVYSFSQFGIKHVGDRRLTMRRKSSPTRSSPCPPSTTRPSAPSNSSVNVSANIASSATLLKIIFASSAVIGDWPAVRESEDAVDTALDELFEDAEDDEPEMEVGGVKGRL